VQKWDETERKTRNDADDASRHALTRWTMSIARAVTSEARSRLVVGKQVPEQQKSAWTSEVMACGKDEVQNEDSMMGNRARVTSAGNTFQHKRKISEEKQATYRLVLTCVLPLEQPSSFLRDAHTSGNVMSSPRVDRSLTGAFPSISRNEGIRRVVKASNPPCV
jgi:hypothetical protein